MFALIPFFLGSLNKNVSIWYEGVSCHSMSLDAILESWGGTTGLCSLGRFVATFAFTPDVKVWEVKLSRLGEFEKVARAFDLIGHSSGAQLHLVPTRAKWSPCPRTVLGRCSTLLSSIPRVRTPLSS